MTEIKAQGSASVTGSSHFYLRRLHSLLGLMPIGAFLCFHLTLNATLLAGPETYQNAVGQLHSLSSIGLLVPAEVLLIFIPLVFHIWLGAVIVFGGSVNLHAYRFGGNFRYVLQRASALVVLAFLVFHLWQMHWLGRPFGGAFFVPDDPHVPLSAARTATAAIQSSIASMVAYGLGLAASAFHLANGIWTSFVTWGITVGPRSQRVSGYLCTGFGALLLLLGLASLDGFATARVPAAAKQAAAEVARGTETPKQPRQPQGRP